MADKRESTRRPFEWQVKLEWLLAKGKTAAALGLLDEIIHDNQLSLFETEAAQTSERRDAWLYRIHVLRRLGRLREALAWTCFECELCPENVTAQALKNQLKRQLRLIPWLADAPAETAQASDFWPGVAGMHQLKAVLERDVLLPQLEPELYERYRLKLPNGVLLYGPLGCGKTFIARKLAEALAFHFIEVKPSDLGSTYVHGTQEKIGELFAQARAKAPSMLFFDELDALLPTRVGELNHHYAAEVNEFLVQFNEAAANRVLVVGATNRLEKIDPAAKRPGRFDKKIYVGLPDLAARSELLARYMDGRPQDVMNLVELAGEAAGYSCAELEHIVNEAARRALASRRALCRDDILAALAANPPANSGQTLD